LRLPSGYNSWSSKRDIMAIKIRGVDFIEFDTLLN